MVNVVIDSVSDSEEGNSSDLLEDFGVVTEVFFSYELGHSSHSDDLVSELLVSDVDSGVEGEPFIRVHGDTFDDSGDSSARSVEDPFKGGLVVLDVQLEGHDVFPGVVGEFDSSSVSDGDESVSGLLLVLGAFEVENSEVSEGGVLLGVDSPGESGLLESVQVLRGVLDALVLLVVVREEVGNGVAE